MYRLGKLCLSVGSNSGDDLGMCGSHGRDRGQTGGEEALA